MGYFMAIPLARIHFHLRSFLFFRRSLRLPFFRSRWFCGRSPSRLSIRSSLMRRPKDAWSIVAVVQLSGRPVPLLLSWILCADIFKIPSPEKSSLSNIWPSLVARKNTQRHVRTDRLGSRTARTKEETENCTSWLLLTLLFKKTVKTVSRVTEWVHLWRPGHRRFMGLLGAITLRIIVVVRWRNGKQIGRKEQAGARRNSLRDGQDMVKSMTDKVSEADLTPDDKPLSSRDGTHQCKLW